MTKHPSLLSSLPHRQPRIRGPTRAERGTASASSAIAWPTCMQHPADGDLICTLASRGNDLAFLNLGFSGDELTTALLSASFGSPESWLTNTKTDVVFAFCGYNEPFKGKDESRVHTDSMP